ncbi:MAG TPA: DUF1810 domain-containing protein [Pirellulales bacterium]|jgi:uncharacterized protein (DUF1810 family)|nr:DUF1810 domain-containing protein [Pirellulales bacterium]
MEDRFELQRFLNAQQDVYPQVVEELQSGEKRSHWMWFIFPQIKGLGRSPTAQKFAIASQAEAQAYAAHAVLGTRLRECTGLVINIDRRSIEQIFPYPDNLKFHSCMTLFMVAAAENALFVGAIDKYFVGRPDDHTLAILRCG